MKNCLKSLLALLIFASLLFTGCKSTEKTVAPTAIEALTTPPMQERIEPLPTKVPTLQRSALLPPETHFHLRISNIPRVLDQLGKSSIGKLWADLQFQDFMEHPGKDVWQNLFFPIGTDAEKDVLMEQLKMLRGEFIVASDINTSRPFIIAAMSEDDFLRSLELDDKIKDVADRPFQIIKRQFQGVEIIQYVSDASRPDEFSSWQAHHNNTLVLGYTEEWVERCIIKLKKDTVEEPREQSILNINVSLSKLIREGWLEDLKTGWMARMADPETLLDALGLMGVEHLSMKINLQDDAMLIDSQLKASDLSKGLFSLLDAKPVEIPSVTFIPEAISRIEVGRLNPLRFWREIPTVLSTALPAFKPQFDMLLSMLQQQSGIQFEDDLLANVGTTYIAFATADADRMVVRAIGLNDSMAFRNALETAFAAPAFQPQINAKLDIQDFLDTPLYVLTGPDPATTKAFAVGEDYLLYGPVDGLRQILRNMSGTTGEKPALANTPLVKELREHVSADAFGYGAVDWKKDMGAVVRQLSKPETVNRIQQNWPKNGVALPRPDFSKLPPPDHIASFFNTSLYYIETVPNGLHLRVILNY